MNYQVDWRDGTMVERIPCSSLGAKFCSQYPCRTSHNVKGLISTQRTCSCGFGVFECLGMHSRNLIQVPSRAVSAINCWSSPSPCCIKNHFQYIEWKPKKQKGRENLTKANSIESEHKNQTHDIQLPIFFLKRKHITLVLKALKTISKFTYR